MNNLKKITGEQTPLPRAVDLFCGCGGMSWGAKQAGFNILSGVDNDYHAIETYRRNFGETVGHRIDLTVTSPQQFAEHLNIKPEELELLMGGPPCQGFSKNVPRKYRFLEDSRNQLVSRFLDYVEYLLPQMVIMENVAEMKNGFGGAYTNEVKERLQKSGYKVDDKILYAPDYGVPQRRRRAFFFANRLNQPVNFPLPSHFEVGIYPLFTNSLNTYPTVYDAIGDLPSLKHGEGKNPVDYDKPAITWFQQMMRKQTNALYDHIARKLQSVQYQRLASIQPGQGAKHLPNELKPKSYFSGAYGRLEWSMLAPTITRWVFHPGSGRFGHPADVRVITIREAARLQSFSDDFIFTGTYIQKSHQVGNAVPPLLMKAIAEKARQLVTH